MVSCGVDLFTEEVFFTLNGKLIGRKINVSRFQGLEKMRQVVGLHSKGEKVRCNFGSDLVNRPFRFDILKYINDNAKNKKEEEEKRFYF